jgi:hypothetical protein
MEVFTVFSQPFHENVGMMPKIRPQLSLFTSFPIDYILIKSFNTTYKYQFFWTLHVTLIYQMTFWSLDPVSNKNYDMDNAPKNDNCVNILFSQTFRLSYGM